MTQISDPAFRAVTITPSDTEIPTTRGVYVGTTGDLIVTMHGDTADVTFANVQSGSILPIQVNYIRASGASDILALY